MTATTEAPTTRLQAFMASPRSEATRVTYESGIRKILGPDPDAFLALDPGRAWDWLKVRDPSPRDSGAASLTIYRGEPEEYVAFISPEAVEAWKRYRESRERVGEKVDAGSPLVRDKWEYGSRWDKERIAPDLAHPLAGQAVKHLLERGWIKAGLRERKVKSEFKAAHGFRKFCKTQLSKAGLSWEDQEVLLGHRMAYYKPTLEHMEQEYLKAVPFLTLSEGEQAKRELTKEKEEHAEKWKEVRLENLELKEGYREIKDLLLEERKAREELQQTVRMMTEIPELAEILKKHSARE